MSSCSVISRRWRFLRSLRSVDFCSMAWCFLWDSLVPNIQLISLLVVSGNWDSLTRSKGCQWNYATNVPPDSRHSQWRRYECCTWGFYPRKMKEGSHWKGTISKRIIVFQPSLFRGYVSLHGWEAKHWSPSWNPEVRPCMRVFPLKYHRMDELWHVSLETELVSMIRWDPQHLFYPILIILMKAAHIDPPVIPPKFAVFFVITKVNIFRQWHGFPTVASSCQFLRFFNEWRVDVVIFANALVEPFIVNTRRCTDLSWVDFCCFHDTLQGSNISPPWGKEESSTQKCLWLGIC